MSPHPAASPAPVRRRVTRRRCLLAVSAAAALLAAGCSAAGSGTSPVPGTITVAAVPGVDDAPLYLAQQHGLFAAAGLHVRIETFGNRSDAAQLAALASGRAQIAASDYGNIFAAQVAAQSSASLRLLADGYDAAAGNVEILVLPRSPITSPAKLPGYPIGVPSELTINGVAATLPQSLDAVAATQVIKNYLLLSALTLNWKPMSQQAELSELRSGQLHAALLTQPYVYQAEADFGAVELMDVFSGQTANLPLSGYVSEASWARQHPAAVTDFQSAIVKAQSEASMVGPVQQTLSKAEGMSAAVADMVSLGTYPTVTSKTALERVIALMSNDRVVKVDTPGFLESLLGA